MLLSKRNSSLSALPNVAIVTQLPNTSCTQRTLDGAGVMLQSRLEQLLVVAVARAEHHAVLAERHRLLVAVGGDVTDGEERHGCR